MTSRRPLRILHALDHSLPVGDGYAFRSHAILREQGRLGWQTLQVTGPKHGPGPATQEQASGLTYLRTPPNGSLASRLPVFDQWSVVTRFRAHLRRIVERERPDLIHAHSPCLNALAAFGLGVPVVYEMRSSWEDAAVSNGTTTEGSPRYRASRALETYALRRADAVITICEGLRTDVIGRGVAPERVTVVPNAVEPADLGGTSESAAVEARRRHGLEGCCVLGFIGSFFAWEGLSLLLDAMPAIVAQRPDVRLLLVGGGNDDAALRAQAERLGLGGHVVFIGRVPHSAVAQLYAATDVLVYPRLPMRLTDMVTPLKPLEAMALGKLQVASDVGGHRELIRDGDTGVLFRAGDPTALAGAVLRLLADSGLQERCKSRGPLWVREERTWDRVVPRYAAVYERVARGGQ